MTVLRRLPWLALAVCLVFLLVNADRGFEITDEGMALIAASHPDDIRIAPTGFAFSTAPLYRLVGGDPGWFRRAGILTLVSSAFVLAFGLVRFAPGLAFFSLAPLAGLGALVFLSPGLTMPSYNMVSACGLLAGAGFFLAGGGESRPGPSRLFFFLSGVGLALAGLAKPPGGATVSAVLLVAALTGKLSLRPLPWILGGCAAVAQHLARQGPSVFFQMIVDGLEFNRRTGEAYVPGVMFPRYAAQIWELLLSSLHISAPALIVLLIALRFLKGGGLLAWLPTAALAATLVSVGGLAGGHRQATDGHNAAALIAALLVLTVVWAVSWRREEQIGDRHRTAFALLALMPLLSFPGTNTPLGFSLLFFCAPWFLVPSLLEPGSKPGPVSLLMTILATAWTLSGPYVSPYRRATPLGEQTVSVEVGDPGGRLRVDRETARFLRSFRAEAAACGVRAGDPVLAFSWTPGLVWAIGGRTVVITHFLSDIFPGARSANEFALTRIPKDVQEKAFVIQTAAGARVHPTLSLGRRRFPEDYRLCFEGDWPARGEAVKLFSPAAVAGATR